MLIDILLATYDSQDFLREQIDSILKQSVSKFRIIAGDGGSGDGTPALLEEYAAANPERFLLLPGGRYSAAENFARLLAASDADFVMFSDHDDVWEPDKIAISLECFRRNFPDSAHVPGLVFTDAKIADRDLNVISESSQKFQHFDPTRIALHQLLAQNIISGNTMFFNRALREAALPIAPEALMHDCWVTLCAAALGSVVYCPRPTILYRQHGRNALGATSSSSTGIFSKLRDGRHQFLRNIRQGQALLKHLDGKLPEEKRKILEAYAAMETQSFLGRRITALRYGFVKNTPVRNFLLFLTM